jgi:hypothetical protein
MEFLETYRTVTMTRKRIIHRFLFVLRIGLRGKYTEATRTISIPWQGNKAVKG